MSTVRTRLEERLGYTFANPALLVQALTHSTYANEHPDSGPHNERLELVGDAVVDLLVAELLFHRMPNATEGDLSRRRAQVVCQDGLARLARALELHEGLRVGEGQRRGKEQANPRLLANTFEAVLGALFLDAGYAKVRDIFRAPLMEAIAVAEGERDFKTSLQEWCHAQGVAPPAYRVLETTGPDHARRYTCEVALGSGERATGTASSKKAAEQQAAAVVFERMVTGA